MSPNNSIVNEIYQEITDFLKSNADPAIVKKYERYFKDGYKGYGIDNKKSEAFKKALWEKWQDDLTFQDALALCERLMASGYLEEFAYAVILISKFRKEFTPEFACQVKLWTQKYVTNWAECDTLCSEVVFPLLQDEVISLSELREWTGDEVLWTRRAACVGPVNMVRRGAQVTELLAIAEPLMEDPEEMVNKGTGWLLRECWKQHPQDVEDLLMKWRPTGRRIIYQYATEKMDKEYRKVFRRQK